VTGHIYPDIDTLALFIARSDIVVAPQPWAATSAGGLWSLPAGFDDTDIAILELIAAEGRRVGRVIARM